MICVNELKDLKVYSRPLYLPFNMKNRKRGSAAFLLTPNIESSINTMKLPYVINNNLFKSYYMEKNINYYITNEAVAINQVGDTYIHGVEELHEDYTRRIVSDPEGFKYIDLKNAKESSHNIDELNKILNDDTYLIADVHINSDKKRTNMILRNINSIVSSKDHLLILGDLNDKHGDASFDTTKDFVSKLNTKNIYLILGNNDPYTVNDYVDMGFKTVTDSFTTKDYVFSHFPMEVDDKRINIHAHIHGSREYLVDPKGHIDVWDDEYKPIKIKDALLLYDTGFYDGVKITLDESAYFEQLNEVANFYGIPEEKKFPMDDAKHVKSAIRFFNYVSRDKEAELAANIIKQAKKFKVEINPGKDNKLRNYIGEAYDNLYKVNPLNISDVFFRSEKGQNTTAIHPSIDLAIKDYIQNTLKGEKVGNSSIKVKYYTKDSMGTDVFVGDLVLCFKYDEYKGCHMADTYRDFYQDDNKLYYTQGYYDKFYCESCLVCESVSEIASKYKLKIQDLYNKSILSNLVSKIKLKKDKKEKFDDSVELSKDMSRILGYSASIAMMGNTLTFPIGLLTLTVRLAKDNVTSKKDVDKLKTIKTDIDSNIEKLESIKKQDDTVDTPHKLSKEERAELERRLDELIDASDDMDEKEFDRLYDEISDKLDADEELEEASKIQTYPTVKSVSGLIENQDHKYLIIYSSTLGCFSLPGAKCEDKDLVSENALKRELKEELNIIPSVYDLFFKSYGFGTYKDDRPNASMYFDDTTYHITSYEGVLRNREPNKCKGFKWMSAKEICNIPDDQKSITLLKLTHLFKTGKIATGVKSSLFEYRKDNIQYYGFKSSIDDIKKYINAVTIKTVMRDLDLPLDKINVNVVVCENFKDYSPSTCNDIYVYSKSAWKNLFYGDYEKYINTEIYAFCLRKLNPNATDLVIYTTAKYLSKEYIDTEKDPTYSKDYNDLCKVIEKIELDHGLGEIRSIIKNNDMKKFYAYTLKYNLGDKYKQNILGEAVLSEKKDDYIVNVDQLLRRSKMKAKRGSLYKINAINRFIDKATDPDEPMPEVKDKDGQVLNPTTAPDLQKTDSGDVNKGVEKAPDVISTDESSLLFESSILNEDNVLMINEEAVSSSPVLKKLLYKERIRRNSELKNIYEKVKATNPNIKYTYMDLHKYRATNLFVDLSYYNEIFFRNNMYTRKKGSDLYAKLLKNLLYADRFTNAGYIKKTVFIPINDWDTNPDTKMWMYTEDINPVSIIYRYMKESPNIVKDIFSDLDVVFVTNSRYFKINFSHFTPEDLKKESAIFLKLFKNLRNNGDKFIEPDDVENPNEESKSAIVVNIVDKLEKSQGIKILNLTGKDTTDLSTSIPKNVETPKETNAPNIASDDKEKDLKKAKEIDKKKEELLDAINTAAGKSLNTDDALEELDNEKIKQIIIDLAAEEEDTVRINQARSSRMLKLQNDLVDKEINGTKIKDLLDETKNQQKLPETKLNIGSINKDWSKVSYINFDKTYDMDADIMSIVTNLSNYSRPIVIRNVSVEDTSTTEDFIVTYIFQMEDYNGKRFNLKFDIPKIIEGNYMILRGNKKTINMQSFLMPIVKTGDDTCQIISNYNKIFIRRSSTLAGKSLPSADRLVKALSKYEGNNTKIINGDNSRICSKYELPIDYVDLCSLYSRIESGEYILYFNQDEIRSLYTVDETKGVPFAIMKGKNPEVVYFNPQELKDHDKVIFPTMSSYISTILTTQDSEFKEIYDNTKAASKHVFSQASILNNKIPLIVIMAYNEGLVTALKKSNITYKFIEKIDKDTRNDINFDKVDTIKFSDGYIVYDVDYNSSLLMNGLKVCPTEDYSLNDINSKSMYIDFLDDFGGRILADGLDIFYDCMIDPITKRILEHYNKLAATDYVSVLAQANTLLSDNKFVKHTDYTMSRRTRRAEIVAAYAHKAISAAYSSYVIQTKRNRTNASFTMKQSAVIDLLMQDPILSDKSFINALSDIEDKNAVSTKGVSGMNSDRSYDLDKRTYDSSMVNILGMSTGFAGNVGVTRQATIDMNVDNERGFVHPAKNTGEMSDVKSLTFTEALTPMGSTHDDPIRTAMTFIQTAKHNATIFESDPMLVTNGADEALPYYSSNVFAFKAKQNGKVVEKTDSYMILEYKDGTKDFVNLEEHIEKNSNGGYYVSLQNVTSLKVGSTFKENNIVAHEKSSFSNSVGEDDNLAYDNGKLTKVAILNTDESYEDSAVVTEKLAHEMGTSINICKSIYIPKGTNIYNVVKKNQPIKEGDPLLVMQTPSSEDDINILLKNLAGDEKEISDLGRIPIKSKVTGRVSDVKIYRTVPTEEMSESLQKLVNSYESSINKQKTMLKKNGIDPNILPATGVLPATGKLKNVEDGVFIEFYLEYNDIVAVGDKIVYYSANKGTCKYIIPEGKEPTTDFRPNETIDAFVGIRSINARMVCSTLLIGSLSKLMVELDRKCKDMAGIPWDESKL